MDPKANEYEEEHFGIDQNGYGNGDNNHEGNDNEDLPMGIPRNNGPEFRRN